MPAATVRELPTSEPTEPASLVESTRRELAAAGREESSLGQQALALAARIGNAHDTGSAIAALSRELRATMAEAMAGAPQAADALDELGERRARKISGA